MRSMTPNATTRERILEHTLKRPSTRQTLLKFLPAKSAHGSPARPSFPRPNDRTDPPAARHGARGTSRRLHGTGREIRASFEREGGASVNGLDTEFPYFVSFAPRILKQSLSLSCSLVGL